MRSPQVHRLNRSLKLRGAAAPCKLKRADELGCTHIYPSPLAQTLATLTLLGAPVSSEQENRAENPRKLPWRSVAHLETVTPPQRSGGAGAEEPPLRAVSERSGGAGVEEQERRSLARRRTRRRLPRLRCECGRSHSRECRGFGCCFCTYYSSFSAFQFGGRRPRCTAPRFRSRRF